MPSHYIVNSTKARSAQPQTPAVTWPASTVWACAAAANRINEGYCKEDVWMPHATPPYRGKLANKVLVQTWLRTGDFSEITPADIALGQAARDYHSRTLTFAALRAPLTEFQATLSRACGLDEISESDRYSVAVISSQISSYLQAQEQDRVRDLVNSAAPAVGTVGSKICTAITVIRSNYSVVYGVYFVNAVTDQGQPVFFSYRESLTTASQHRISGTVKALRPDATQLNRVKIIKEVS